MTKRILIVDDEKYIRNILDFSLGGEGFEVITAENGEEALTKSVDLHPDLIVLDVMMPKIDGFEVCRALKTKSDTKDIPIVILTAKDRDEDREKGQAAGVDRYMTKPFSPGRLVDLVQELLGMKQH
jgi:CheY-like chemotaxis protein